MNKENPISPASSDRNHLAHILPIENQHITTINQG